MLSSYFSLFLIALQTSASARHIADSIPRALQERAPRAPGGWAYASQVCPTDLDQCGSSWCCPTSLTCVHTSDEDNLCCPGTVDCTNAFETKPYCADDSWSLWDQSTGGININGYFCCQPGEVGLMTGFCIASNAIVEGEVTALALLPGGLPSTSGAAATVLSTVSPSIPASTNAVTTTIIKTAATPAASGSSAAVVTSTSSVVAAIPSPTPASTSSILVPSSTAHSVTPVSVTSSSTSTSAPPVKTSGADSHKNSGSLWTILTGLSLAYACAF